MHDYLVLEVAISWRSHIFCTEDLLQLEFCFDVMFRAKSLNSGIVTAVLHVSDLTKC